MSDPPTLVFVPGAWHKPTCYGKIIKLLQEHQLKCISVTLPSTTGNPDATFKDDLDAAQRAIAGETSQGRNVVVIAHSYGGMVGNSAVKGFTRPLNEIATSATSANGHVVGLVLIASGCTFTGLAFMDPFFGIPPPSWRVNKETGFADILVDPREFFYHDLPADEAEYWASQLAPQSLKALFEGGEYSYAGWQDVPVWYIGTVEDRGLPVVVQRMNVGMAREMGAVIEHRELQTSHSPFLSQPDEVAQIMIEAVGTITGKALVREQTTRRKRNEIAVPASKFWKPLTWFRFGLPLFFGHLVGRGVVIFGWGRRLWQSVFR
ncbi:hypothetical protein ABW20_dc0105499 [Dactylellina cionopaga]|nr:hypothetical protein ABW20_dc0105499 [Dactylellina cionopaga]